ncbi:hypothetical protein J3459_011163 [Metarhizium acridum]|nr:hypothetical protein J3459_011163 [Metarhizium acridum]
MRVRRRVHHLDWSLFTIFGVGFGWSTVIGIIPGIGDAIDGLMSLSVFRKCCKVEGGLPASVKLHMMVNVALDFIIGLVPGAEAIYRGNTRNALLLEDFLRERAEGKIYARRDTCPIAPTQKLADVRAKGCAERIRGFRGMSAATKTVSLPPDEFPDGHGPQKKRSGRR